MGILSKRIPTLLGLSVLVLGIGGGIWMVQRQKPKVDQEAIKPQQVRVTNVTDTKFSVSWITKMGVEGKVMYGKVGEKLDQEAKDDRDGSEEAGKYATHHVTITGLQPDTEYAFRIVSGEARFDNNGSPYVVKTGPVLGSTPPAETIYGQVKKNESAPAVGALVYVEIPGATPLSTLVKESGSWAIPISVARTADLRSYVSYDPEATIFTIRVTDGRKEAVAKAALKFAKPTPDIVLGRKYEFLAKEASPDEETVVETGQGKEASESGSRLAQGETPKIFNIEPLGSTSDESEVTIVYPEEGEVVTTEQPEFRGTGPAGTDLSISLESATGELSLSEVVTVEDDGVWTWIPEEPLEEGSYEMRVEYWGQGGQTESVKRVFKVSLDEITPAFEASESGDRTEEASSATQPKTRVSMPATDSGIPVSGVMDQTWLTAMIGFGIIVLGIAILAF